MPSIIELRKTQIQYSNQVSKGVFDFRGMGEIETAGGFNTFSMDGDPPKSPLYPHESPAG
jgi:hypothetical protein